MTPEADKLIRPKIDHVLTQVGKAVIGQRAALEAEVKAAIGTDGWEEVIKEVAEKLGKVPSKDQLQELQASAAAFLTALTVFAGLDIPDFSQEEPTSDKGVEFKLRKQVGGMKSKFGPETRFGILATIVERGRGDREIANRVLHDSSTEAIARVSSVASHYRNFFEKVARETKVESVKELVALMIKSGVEPKFEEALKTMGEKYGELTVADFISTVLTSGRRRKLAGETPKALEQKRTKEKRGLELDDLFERVLESSLLREGCLSEIAKEIGVDNLEAFAMESEVILPEECLTFSLELLRDVYAGEPISQRDCNRVKILVWKVLSGKEKYLTLKDGYHIGSLLLVAISQKIASDQIKAQAVYDLLFPGKQVSMDVGDGLIRGCN